MRSFPFLALSAVHIESSFDVQAMCRNFSLALGILSPSGRSRDAASAGSFFSSLVLFSLLWLRSLYLDSFLLLRFLVIFNAEGLSIDFDFFERDSVRRLLNYYHVSSRPITRLLCRAWLAA